MKDKHCSHCGAAFDHESYPKKCAGCSMVTFRNPLPVAVMLVPVEDGLLVVRRAHDPKKGFLSLPGGYMELGETWQKACARELKEETSVDIHEYYDGIELFDVRTGGLGHLLVFGITRRQTMDVSKLLHDAEVTEITILRKHQVEELAFESHIEMAKRYFEKGSPLKTTPIPTVSKWVVVTALDQTVGFWDGEGWTTEHPKAILWDTEAEAIKCADDDSHLPVQNYEGRKYTEEERQGFKPWVQEVIDESEFRGQPDTW